MSSSPPSSSSSNINLSLSPVSLWEGGSHLGLQECDCDGGALILIVLIILIIFVNMMITIITGNALQENAELSSGQFIRPIISFISHLTSADSNNRCLSPIFSVYLRLHLRRAGGRRQEATWEASDQWPHLLHFACPYIQLNSSSSQVQIWYKMSEAQSVTLCLSAAGRLHYMHHQYCALQCAG